MAKIMTMMSKQLLGYSICLHVKFPKTHGHRIGQCSCLEWYKKFKASKNGQLLLAKGRGSGKVCGVREFAPFMWDSKRPYQVTFQERPVYIQGKVFYLVVYGRCQKGLFLFSCLAYVSNGLILMSASDTQTKSTFNSYY